jgi:hypothetical protein
MRVAHALQVGLLLLAASGPSLQGSQRDALTREVHAGTASLDGIVTITIDGRPSPVRRARVIVASASDSQSTDTDTAGRFHLDRLASGLSTITVSKFGFVPAGRVPTVVLRDNDHATTTVAMLRGSAIDGRLTTADGEPAIGLTVTAGRLGYGPYGRFVAAVQQTTTDDVGRYRLHTLPEGEYYLSVAPDPIRQLQTTGVQGPSSKPTLTYFAGGPAGTPRLNEARVVTLDVGQQARGLDFTLISGTSATLTAKVTTSAGAAPASLSFRIQRVGAPPGEIRCALLSAGAAICPNMSPGDFWVLVAARSVSTGPNEYAVSRLTMEGRDASVTLVTAAGVGVGGRVESEDGVALPVNLHVIALDTDYELPAVAMGQPATAPSAPVTDGVFAIPDLMGPRLIRVGGLPEGWTVKAVQLGTTEITDTPTTFAAGPDSSALRVVITAQTGSVGGAVLTALGQPDVGSRVVVFSRDARTWGARSRFIATAETGPDGRYAIHGLLPGQYLVAVAAGLTDGAWEDPERLTRLQPSAAPITIAARATTTLDWRPK